MVCLLISILSRIHQRWTFSVVHLRHADEFKPVHLFEVLHLEDCSQIHVLLTWDHRSLYCRRMAPKGPTGTTRRTRSARSQKPETAAMCFSQMRKGLGESLGHMMIWTTLMHCESYFSSRTAKTGAGLRWWGASQWHMHWDLTLRGLAKKSPLKSAGLKTEGQDIILFLGYGFFKEVYQGGVGGWWPQHNGWVTTANC